MKVFLLIALSTCAINTIFCSTPSLVDSATSYCNSSQSKSSLEDVQDTKYKADLYVTALVKRQMKLIDIRARFWQNMEKIKSLDEELSRIVKEIKKDDTAFYAKQGFIYQQKHRILTKLQWMFRDLLQGFLAVEINSLNRQMLLKEYKRLYKKIKTAQKKAFSAFKHIRDIAQKADREAIQASTHICSDEKNNKKMFLVIIDQALGQLTFETHQWQTLIQSLAVPYF